MNPPPTPPAVPPMPVKVPEWALHAVHELNNLTRFWFTKEEEDKAAAIILKHAPPSPALPPDVEKLVEELHFALTTGWATQITDDLLRRTLAALRSLATAREDAERLAEALERMVQLAQDNWSSKEYYQSNPQKHVVVYRLWQLMREALAAHRDAKGEKR